MLLLALACASGKPDTAEDSARFGDSVPSGLDTGASEPFTLLAGEEVTSCNWARFEGESVAPDGTRFWFDAEIPLDRVLGFSQTDPGPLDGSATLDHENVLFTWMDLDHPSGTSLVGWDCAGRRISIDGSVCFGFGGEFSIHAERTTSSLCGDESAWLLTFHATGVEPACLFTGLEATEFGPFQSTIEPSSCG